MKTKGSSCDRPLCTAPRIPNEADLPRGSAKLEERDYAPRAPSGHGRHRTAQPVRVDH
jgi:hypothetical protein